jgi:hypothetical protein
MAFTNLFLEQPNKKTVVRYEVSQYPKKPHLKQVRLSEL